MRFSILPRVKFERKGKNQISAAFKELKALGFIREIYKGEANIYKIDSTYLSLSEEEVTRIHSELKSDNKK